MDSDKTVIGSGRKVFSPKTERILLALAIVTLVVLIFSGVLVRKSLGANAGGTSSLGRGWTSLGQMPTGGLSYSAAASICKVDDPTIANTVNLQGKLQITSGQSASSITAGIYTKSGQTYQTGNSIAIAPGNLSTTALTPSISPTATVGVVLYGPDYTTISSSEEVANIQYCS